MNKKLIFLVITFTGGLTLWSCKGEFTGAGDDKDDEKFQSSGGGNADDRDDSPNHDIDAQGQPGGSNSFPQGQNSNNYRTDLNSNNYDNNYNGNGNNLGAPTGLVDTSDGRLAGPDYNQCSRSSNPSNPGLCPPNNVLIGVNDGESGGAVCCPFTGQNIFLPNQQPVQKPSCDFDEVMVGYYGKYTGAYCMKINSQYLQRSGQATTILVGSSSAVDPVIQRVGALHAGDGCSCPKNYVMVGGPHSMSDNSCTDQCAMIMAR